MQEDFRLIGDFTPTELNDSGITLVAPGLQGRGTWHSRRETGETRAFTGEQGLLDQAIAESGAEDRHTLLVEAPTPEAAAAAGGVRGTGDVADDELLLQVPEVHEDRLVAARDIGRVEDGSDVFDRHIELAEPADRLRRRHLRGRVAAVPLVCVDVDRLEHSDVVVVPERLHAQIRHLGELADRQQGIHA